MLTVELNSLLRPTRGSRGRDLIGREGNLIPIITRLDLRLSFRSFSKRHYHDFYSSLSSLTSAFSRRILIQSHVPFSTPSTLITFCMGWGYNYRFFSSPDHKRSESLIGQHLFPAADSRNNEFKPSLSWLPLPPSSARPIRNLRNFTLKNGLCMRFSHRGALKMFFWRKPKRRKND